MAVSGGATRAAPPSPQIGRWGATTAGGCSAGGEPGRGRRSEGGGGRQGGGRLLGGGEAVQDDLARRAARGALPLRDSGADQGLRAPPQGRLEHLVHGVHEDQLDLLAGF